MLLFASSALLSSLALLALHVLSAFAWGGELLEPDGFYLSCLSDRGVNTGNTAPVNQLSPSLGQAGDYLCSSVALFSAPPPCRALLKKTH